MTHNRVFAEGLEIEVRLTGSAVYGKMMPKDIDYIGQYHEHYEKELLANDWKDCAEGFEDYPKDAFAAFRKGHVNLILYKSAWWGMMWDEAHDFLVKHPLWAEPKSSRIIVFEHFRNRGDRPENKHLVTFIQNEQKKIDEGLPF